MESKTFLSVILSTHNDEKFISQAVTSILNQTYPYFELIIINDGSTDQTGEIIRSMTDKRIIYVEKENTGLADSLNIGIHKSKYDWIVRMDGDDISLPDRFEKQVAAITPNVDIIGTSALLIDIYGNMCGKIVLPSGKEQLLRLVKRAKPIFIHPTVMIRKTLLEKVGFYDSNFKRSQDMNLWLRCLISCNELVNLETPLLYYRLYSKNRTTSLESLANAILSQWLFYNKQTKPLEKDDYGKLVIKIKSTYIYKVLKKGTSITRKNILFQRGYNLLFSVMVPWVKKCNLK